MKTSRQIVDEIVEAAQAGDEGALAANLADLHAHLDETGAALGPGDAHRLVEAVATSRAAAAAVDESQAELEKLFAAVREEAAKPEPREATWEEALQDLAEALTRPTPLVSRERAEAFLGSLKSFRAFDALERFCDIFITRGVDTPIIRTLFAQAMIENGRHAAAIAVLTELADSAEGLSWAHRTETCGLLGRVNLQIYTERSELAAGRAVAVPQLRDRLRDAARWYGSVYRDPARDHWPGVALVAISARAEADGVALDQPIDGRAIARDIVDALADDVARGESPWSIASAAEANLGLGNWSEAARLYGVFAKNATRFMLGSAIRRLEQVWRVRAGPSGPGLSLSVLKGALAINPSATVKVTLDELRVMGERSASQQAELEAMVDHGDFVPMQMFFKLVELARGVAMIRDRTLRTIGTGFLIRAAELDDAALADEVWLVTNAHVVRDPNGPPQALAFTPSEVTIGFEAERDAAGEVRSYRLRPEPVWQSPIAVCDVSVWRIGDGFSAGAARPLALASSNREIRRAEGPGAPGDLVSAMGHPRGRQLSLSLRGALMNLRGEVLDYGPRGAGELDPVYLHYNMPTEPGNSGSPVFEATTWKVVGVHHAGFPGAEGRPRLRGSPESHRANEGVCIQSIRRLYAEEKRRSGRRRGRR